MGRPRCRPSSRQPPSSVGSRPSASYSGGSGSVTPPGNTPHGRPAPPVGQKTCMSRQLISSVSHSGIQLREHGTSLSL